MKSWVFWVGLYVVCVLAGMLVTPGLPEAIGFAVPAVMAAALVAWLARRRAAHCRMVMAGATAAALMIGAMTGVYGQAGGWGGQAPIQTADLSRA